MNNPRHYPIEVRPMAADDGHGWLASFPDLPGLLVFNLTLAAVVGRRA